MKQTHSGGVNWMAVLAGSVVVLVAAAVAVQTVPELAPVRRYTEEAEEIATQLPRHARSLFQRLRERLDRARSAFRAARAESERVLTAQFEEAKQRGSVPPI